jgi:penicillin amidase
LYNWSGYYDFYELPANLNPDNNYIIQTNSKPNVFNQDEYYTSFFHYQGYRYSRIEQLINNKDKLNPEYIKNINDDELDLAADDILPKIIESLRDKDDYSYTETEYALIDILENWDYKTNPDSTGALVFNELYYHIMSITLKDELSESEFKSYLANDILYTNFVNLIKKPESSWFDDKDTIAVENLELVLKKSLANSYKSLKSRFGNKLKNWTWGKTHKTKYKHLLGDIFPYNMIFNSKDIKLRGSFVSISKTIYDFDSLYNPISHNGVKFISNMQFIRSSEFLSATGNSGHFHNENYLDQLDKWYRKDNFRDPVNSKEEAYKVMNNRIKLVPKD